MSKKENKITKMIILGPDARFNPQELVRRIHMLGLPITIKETCYGALIHGEKEYIKKAEKEIRKFDIYNIFIKERGFPPGDPRRCRAHRGGAREGYHQLEKEFRALKYVSEALKHPRKVSLEEPKKLPVEVFRDIVKKMVEKWK